MNIQKVVLLLNVFIALQIVVPAKAQNINQQNFSNIRVDELSDDQIRQFVKQVESSGMSEAQLEQVATARGMSSSEIQKLRQRVEKIKTQGGGAASGTAGKKEATLKSKDGSRSRSFEGEVDSLSKSDSKNRNPKRKLLWLL